MPIRLWPNDYVKKEHITSYERYLLRNAEKNFKDGHFVVDIDPVRMSDSTLKMGMYLSPSEGLVTYSLFPGDINVQLMDVYINHVQTVENKIYERLLDSKILIIRAGEYKVLKFPYKHMILFQNELTGNLADSYCFKRSCANFENNCNLHIMTFHKLVKKIYEECLHQRCAYLQL